MKLGFGCSRISNQTHVMALEYAINSGIKYIDIAPYYAQGRALTLVGEALKRTDTTNVTLIAQCGFIKGDMLKGFENHTPTEDVTVVSPHVYHTITSDFIRAQAHYILQYIHKESIDIFMLDSPEVYSVKHADGGDIKSLHQTVLTRVYEAFITLETLVKEGTINGYGISANGFSAPKDSVHFMPYTTLVELALLGAQKVGNKQHSFKAIALPINALNTQGLVTASWAKRQGLQVIAYHVLDVTVEHALYRLAQYEYPNEYERALNEALDITQMYGISIAYNLIQQLDETVHKYGFVGDYDAFLHANVMPTFFKALAPLEHTQQIDVMHYIDAFLLQYRQAVLYECTKHAVSIYNSKRVPCDKPLQECAIQYVYEQKDIDAVLLGMRKVKYVQEAISTLDNLGLIKPK